MNTTIGSCSEWCQHHDQIVQTVYPVHFSCVMRYTAGSELRVITAYKPL